MKTILIPRWSGNAQSDWYPRAGELKLIDHIIEMPNPSWPRIDAWTQHLQQELPKISSDFSDVRIITHSVACHALMKAIETLNITVKEVVMVAPWWTIDEDYWRAIGGDWAHLEEWIDYDIDLNAVRKKIAHWSVAIGTQDALAPHYLENLQRWLNIPVDASLVVPQAQHFNAKEQTELWRLLKINGAD